MEDGGGKKWRRWVRLLFDEAVPSVNHCPSGRELPRPYLRLCTVTVIVC